MKPAAVAVALFFGLAFGLMYFEHPDRAGLPLRPLTGNHGQGNSIDAEHCPAGARPFYVYADDGTKFFLECVR